MEQQALFYGVADADEYTDREADVLDQNCDVFPIMPALRFLDIYIPAHRNSRITNVSYH